MKNLSGAYEHDGVTEDGRRLVIPSGSALVQCTGCHQVFRPQHAVFGIPKDYPLTPPEWYCKSSRNHEGCADLLHVAPYE